MDAGQIRAEWPCGDNWLKCFKVARHQVLYNDEIDVKSLDNILLFIYSYFGENPMCDAVHMFWGKGSALLTDNFFHLLAKWCNICPGSFFKCGTFTSVPVQ